MASRFRSIGLDLQQELGPHQARDDQEQRGRARAAEMARAHLGVGRDIGGTQQILRPRLSMVTMWRHASSACAPKSDGTFPPASSPGVPAVMSQRAFAGTSTASL